LGNNFSASHDANAELLTFVINVLLLPLLLTHQLRQTNISYFISCIIFFSPDELTLFIFGE
jgi:hypothetical protein